MNGTGAMLVQLSKMPAGRIAFMLVKIVFGIKHMHPHHDAVAGDLCDHACSSDTEAECVAPDQGGLWDWEWTDRQPVDQHMLRGGGQPLHGKPHRLVCGAQDIETV